MSLLAAFRKTKTSTVDKAAAQLARGDQVDVSALTEADVAAVEDRAAELRRLAELQPVAKRVDSLRDQVAQATEQYRADRAAWLDAARDAARQRFRVPTPEQPDPQTRRLLKSQLQDAEAALREAVALVPEHVASAYVAADHAHQVARANANHAIRTQAETPARRAKLQASLEKAGSTSTYGKEPIYVAPMRAQLAELPSDKQLAADVRATDKALKAAAKARTAALKALCAWKPQ